MGPGAEGGGTHQQTRVCLFAGGVSESGKVCLINDLRRAEGKSNLDPPPPL